MPISKEYIQDLHDRADIEEVISSYVSLKRTGRNLKGLCPFHSEKTASFTVFPDTKSFYCFGCQASGDVISFVMRMDNLDYVEAVKSLASRFGMAMPDEGYDDSFSKLRMRILSANREAARFFNSQLYVPENKKALEYFAKRGLTKQTITHFGLGYAPDDWRALLNHLRSLGYTEQELVLANLAVRSNKNGKTNVYDSFRNRIMFPILDLRGNVVAFGGRVMDDSKPKYINTADTPVYKKGSGIFALNFAKNSAEKKLILVEGYMDVITLHQAGITNAVACLGTAFTQEQASLLSRYAEELYVCYDNDAAGKNATKKALQALDKTGLKVKVVRMEDGKDADEIVRTSGKLKFLEFINKANNETEYRLSEELGKYNVMTDDGKAKYLIAAAEILAECNPIERDIYAQRLANEFSVSKESIMIQASSAARRLGRRRAQEKEKEITKISVKNFEDKNNPERKANLRAANAEETLIASLMRNPDFYREIKGEFTPDDFVTAFNRRVITCLIELIEGNYSTDLSMFAQDFSPGELDSIGRIYIKSGNLANTVKECRDCIGVLKNSSGAVQQDARNMTDEEFLNAVNKLRKREEK